MVTFCTKTYFGDYHKFLSGAFERKLNACNYRFDDEVLYINNGVLEDVKFNCKTSDVISKMDEVLEFFKLKNHDFKGGLWYSIAELTAIYECKTEYLCWVEGDCLTEGDWVREGIKILEENPDVSVVSPYSECNTWGDDWHFSDQAFLIRTKEFRKPIYEECDLPDYPSYAGNSFEKMCGNYLKKNNKIRKIIYESFCHHEVY